ncbi:phosducin-like protein 1 [Trichomonascus vanleenenianus]|uniref:Plp1p n=1 Tax=Trichomonascus vanleenenianus TaxID=2268995 RepID=UPI003ECAD080
MDSKTSRVLESYQDELLDRRDDSDREELQDDEDFMDLLDGDDDAFMNGYREKRMQELAASMKSAKENISQGYGSVTEVSEKEVLETTTGEAKYCIVHFKVKGFKKCQTMAEKLRILARRHVQTRFLEVEAPEAPFLVTKLNIKVLPCVIAYVSGKEVMRFVGFEKLGNGEDFPPEVLERQLFAAGAILRKANDLSRPVGLRAGKVMHSGINDDYDDVWD